MRPEAFDAFAADYDSTFTESALGQLLRPRVWRILEQVAEPGQRVLELACGTGADAQWLAGRGVNVVATDGSSEMVAAAQAKATSAGVGERVTAVQMNLQSLIEGQLPDPVAAISEGSLFDGLLSNFGGLNTIPNWQRLADRLADMIRPAGWLVLVVMGPVCPWEVGWHLAHIQWKAAFRRRDVAMAQVGEHPIPIWYPSPGRLRRAFEPWFQLHRTESLGLFLPPSYLNHLVDRWPDLFARLAKMEAGLAHLTAGWGDHYIMLLERAVE